MYTYAGPVTYTIQATAFNRSGATNLGTGESVFLVKTTFSAIPYLGRNSTPMLALPPSGLQLAANQRVLLNMAATDPENDSLAYVLSAPITSVDSQTANLCNAAIPVSLYRFPNDVNYIGTYRMNAKTGLLTWDSPTEQGRYIIALTVSEWRNGVNISETKQELTLTVVDKGGTPVTPPPYEPAIAGFLTAVDDSAPDELQPTVSPNPSSSGLVQVSLQNRLGAPAIFSVLDNQGRVHQRIEKNQPLDQQHFRIDLSSHPAGLYLIRAESGGRQVMQKVVRE